MKTRKTNSILRTVNKFFGKLYHSAKKEFNLFIVIGLLLNVIQLLSLISQKLFFDQVSNVLLGGVNLIYAYFIFFAFILIMQQVMNGLYNYIFLTTMEKLQLRVLEMIHHKALKIDPVEYEKKEFLDMEEKGRAGANSIVSAVVTSVIILTAYLPFFIGLAIYVTILNPPLLAILIFVFIPVIVGLEVRKRVFTELENKVAIHRKSFGIHKGNSSNWMCKNCR